MLEDYEHTSSSNMNRAFRYSHELPIMFILAIDYKTIFKNAQTFTSYVVANDNMGFTHKQLAEYHIAVVF